MYGSGRVLSNLWFKALSTAAVLLSQLCLASEVVAQTAEDAVLMMVFGLDQAAASSPSNTFGKPIRLTKKANCWYDATFPGDTADAELTMSLDFTELQNYSVQAHSRDPRLSVPVIIGKNFIVMKSLDRKTGQVQELGRADRLDQVLAERGYPQPRARLEAAASYFRANFCKGRAF